MRKKKLQMNLSNVDNRDWQINVSMRKKKLQMNLLNVGKRDFKHIKSIEKLFPIVLPLLMKFEYFMWLFLEVHCTFVLTVTNCGINTVLLRLKG